MIYTDRLQKIQLALTLGKPIEPENDEEAEFIKSAKKETAEIRKRGNEVSMINEWPD